MLLVAGVLYFWILPSISPSRGILVGSLPSQGYLLGIPLALIAACVVLILAVPLAL